MKVKFSFDRVAVEQWGYTMQDVHRTAKELFAVHELPCVSDGTVLAFKDKGHGDDFAAMWDIILPLGERPANGGAKALTARGGEGAQASQKCTFLRLAGEIP